VKERILQRTMDIRPYMGTDRQKEAKEDHKRPGSTYTSPVATDGYGI